MANKLYSDPVVTPLHRAAFAYLFKPDQKKDNQTGQAYDEYSVVMLIPKNDPAISNLVGAYNQVMTALYGADQSKWPTFRNPTFRDGDTDPTYRDANKYPGFQGMWVVKATSNQQPGLLDERKQPVITDGVLYSGMWGYAQVVASNYESQGNQGVKFYLNNYMKFRDDARMGGNGQTAEQAFAGIQTPAAPAGGMPGQAAPMQQPGMMHAAPAAPMAQQGYAPPAPQMPGVQPGQAPAAPAFPGASGPGQGPLG
jgi:hypothetical protein